MKEEKTRKKRAGPNSSFLLSPSSFRQDAVTGRWVIIAAGRAQRPHAFPSSAGPQPEEPCPFCEGREEETPGEVLAYRRPGSAPNGPGWRVRVVPNKFPAVMAGETQGESTVKGDGLYAALPGEGVHEVVIESPRHVTTTSALSVKRIGEVFTAYRRRLAALRQDDRLKHALVFKNVGAAAGATVEHLHSQLIATPMVPRLIQEELDGAMAYYRRHDRCVYCDLVARELAAGERIVLDVPGFLAFCPFAARMPLETWIVPKVHAGRYEEIEKTAIAELSAMMKTVMDKLEAILKPLAYNYFIHTAPFDSPSDSHYHWHIEVIPSLTTPAGFEWGAGCHINPVPPEAAAERLR